MLNPHVLSGPEITVLLAASGLIVNASVNLFINARKRSKRILAKGCGEDRSIGKHYQERF